MLVTRGAQAGGDVNRAADRTRRWVVDLNLLLGLQAALLHSHASPSSLPQQPGEAEERSGQAGKQGQPGHFGQICIQAGF